MKFVHQSKYKLISMEEEQNCDNESKEPDYDEDIESDEKQEEKTGKIIITTNQVF
jgi:hypothetical protein